MNSLEITKAKEYFYQKKYKDAYDIFLKNSDYSYEAGLCVLLTGDLAKTRKLWKLSKKNSPASEFGLIILDYIELKISKTPSFFQTRAFLEVFLNLFLENNLLDWAQNLVSRCDDFAKSNPESFKFIARALFSNGYFNLAITFCKKSMTICDYDPEALIILAQCYFLIGELGEALDVVNKSLVFAPQYYPSKLLREIIFDEINKKG